MKKTCNLDIMVGKKFDKFYCQLRYEYLPCFKLDLNYIAEWVMEKRPELKKMKFRIEFGQRVI